MTVEQLAIELPLSAGQSSAPEPRNYWENRGPNQWEPVAVRTRYALPGPPPDVPFPHLTLGTSAPRNVLVERADGSRSIRPVRILRCKEPYRNQRFEEGE